MIFSNNFLVPKKEKIKFRSRKSSKTWIKFEINNGNSAKSKKFIISTKILNLKQKFRLRFIVFNKRQIFLTKKFEFVANFIRKKLKQWTKRRNTKIFI